MIFDLGAILFFFFLKLFNFLILNTLTCMFYPELEPEKETHHNRMLKQSHITHTPLAQKKMEKEKKRKTAIFHSNQENALDK